MNILERFKKWYRDLPNKKTYLEFISALLTIPVLLTVIITNVNNLNKNNKPETSPKQESQATQPQVKEVIITSPQNPTTTQAPLNNQCIKKVGPVSIVYPEENQTVTKDPVCIDISYKDDNYCSVVWSYRINGGSWSDFDDNSICLYNLSSGQKKLELKVKSIASSDSTILTRNFTVNNSNTASSSASTQ